MPERAKGQPDTTEQEEGVLSPLEGGAQIQSRVMIIWWLREYGEGLFT